jgi:hypothetical protein
MEILLNKKERDAMSRTFASALGVMLLLGLIASPLTAQVKPPVTSHPLQGMQNCVMCHAAGAMPTATDVPANHKDWGNETCQWCHAATSPLQVNPVAGPITHALAGMQNCVMCHAAGAMPTATDVPANHKDLPNESCVLCHKPQGR